MTTAASTSAGCVLVVDDDPLNRRLLSHVLEQDGHRVTTAEDGGQALDLLFSAPFDLVLLDIRMPGMDGHQVCRRIRAHTATQALPVVMITAEGLEEKLTAIEAGADDFILKPFDRAELLARVRSLLRIKRYHDTIQTQALELEELNHGLERRVAEQVEELGRVGRLRRFLAPQVADLVCTSGDESFLRPHRTNIAVWFADMRGFTTFSGATEPEEVIRVLEDFHGTVGSVLTRFEATVGYLAGDSVMAYFNDPVATPAPERKAVEMAVALRDAMRGSASRWRRLGHELDVGMGIACGHATLGMVGFEGRFEYTPIGPVVNLAARLCAQAAGGQILISRRVHAATEELVEVENLGELRLKGFERPEPMLSLVGLRQGRAADALATP
jgi:class 3 adenylate cyclase/CheY-like chemotaxis protein